MQPQLPSGVESTPEILTSEELCAAGGKKKQSLMMCCKADNIHG